MTFRNKMDSGDQHKPKSDPTPGKAQVNHMTHITGHLIEFPLHNKSRLATVLRCNITLKTSS